MYRPALSIIVQIWKQPRCPPVAERINKINKLRPIQIMDCYWALHRNELSGHGGNENGYHRAKEACLKRLHTAGFQMYILLVKAQLCRNGKDEGLQGLGWVAMNRWSTDDFFFSGSETTLYTIITDFCSHTFVQTHRMHNEEWTVE